MITCNNRLNLAEKRREFRILLKATGAAGAEAHQRGNGWLAFQASPSGAQIRLKILRF